MNFGKTIDRYKKSCREFIAEFKGEKSIRSETSKVFLVIFAILLTVGAFTVSSSIKGAKTFNNIQGIYLKQFQSAGTLKQKSLEIIGIYYLLVTDLDMNVLMEQLQRYDGLAEKFQSNLKDLKDMLEKETPSAKQEEALKLVKKIGQVFDQINNNARGMTFSLMEGNKEASKKSFNELNKDINTFLASVDQFESLVEKALRKESSFAQKLLEGTTWAGFIIIFFGVIVTLRLIAYLMKFLSVSLLPISNLMHNMRQAVFSIDKNLLVISPVSKYSNTVFGQEIVGESVQEFLFKSLDPKGPIRASLDTAMGAVFGADDIQWMLMEDCFPPKVEYSRSGNFDDTKILKLTYTPLWDKEGLLASLMIVAEDITEIERLREESSKKDGELNIIQSLVDMSRTEVAPFLNLSREQVNEAKQLVEKMHESKGNRELLFRVLHTLKGNSRMYGLNSIADAVHIAESVVVEINVKFANNEFLSPDVYMQLQSGLDQVESALGGYFSMASKLFGIDNNYSSDKVEKFRTSLIEAESYLWNEVHFDQNNLQQRVDKVIKTSAFFKLDDLYEILNKNINADIKLAEKRSVINNLKPGVMEKFFKNGLCNPIQIDPSQWIPLFEGIYYLSEAYHWWKEGHISGKDFLHSRCRSIISQAELMTLSYPLAQAQKILFQAEGGKPNQEIKSLITSLWIYMGFVCHLDGLNSFEKSQAQTLSPWNMNAGNFSHLFYTAAGYFKKQEISEVTFKYMATDFLPFPVDTWECFWGSKEMYYSIEALFDAVRSPDFEKNIASIRKIEGVSIMTLAILVEAKYSLVLLSEIARLIIPKNQSIDQEHFGLSRKMVEIPSTALSHLIRQVHFMNTIKTGNAELEQSKEDVQRTLDRMLEVPIKSMVWKMAPMVHEIAHKLGKHADLKISGPDFTLPRNVLFDLRDALVHMVRNSLDHGLEVPEARRLAGKAEKGLIEINFEEIIPDEVFQLIIKDDGHGIDIPKLTAKAIRNGLISQEMAETLSDKSKLDLIFSPNLSTKDEVTALSGRGVGMDAVKAIIERLGGRISIESNFGFGTKFTFSFSRNKAITALRNAA